jgi:hypothetical protein
MPRDDKGRSYQLTEAERRKLAFDDGMAVLCDMHKRELKPVTLRAYFEAIERMSAAMTEETFRRAIEGERFFPTVATLKAYAAGVPDDRRPAIKHEEIPRYTPEQRADIERMKAEMRANGLAMPWSKELPASQFMGRGFGA